MKDGTFHGDQLLTRLQFAFVLKSMIREFEGAVKTSLAQPKASRIDFADMGPYSAAITDLVGDQANRYGLFDGLSGISEGRFEPGKTVTRYEYARVIGNLLQNAEGKGVIKTSATSAPLPFTDIDAGQADTVQLAFRHFGVMNGFPDNTFRGNESMTRYQFAAGAVKVLPTLQAMIVKVKPTPAPTPMAQPTAQIIIVPAPTPKPVPTPTPVIYQPTDYSATVVYGVVPNNTPIVGSTQGLFGIRLNAAQDINNFLIMERGTFLPTAPVTSGSLAMLGLGLGYRVKVTDNFHIIPSVGTDLWAHVDTNTNALLATGGGGLSMEWWIIPQLSVLLSGEARQGYTKISYNGVANPNLNLLYGGDFQLRYRPIPAFAIQLGASAWGTPQVGGNGTQDLLIGPNGGVAWAF
jgi:hypothetical protein